MTNDDFDLRALRAASLLGLLGIVQLKRKADGKVVRAVVVFDPDMRHCAVVAELTGLGAAANYLFPKDGAPGEFEEVPLVGPKKDPNPNLN